jgi:hypothetical protein
VLGADRESVVETDCEVHRCSMKSGEPVQRCFHIEPRKWRQHAHLEALRRQLEIATEEMKRDPERASLVATLAAKYSRAHASWVADLTAGRPKKDRTAIMYKALEIWKTEGNRAAVEFIRTSVKANEGIELKPSTCSYLLGRINPNRITAVRLSPEIESAITAWAGQQDDKPSKGEAICRLIELGLNAALPQMRQCAELQASGAENLSA